MVYNANLPRGTNPTWTSGANNANALMPIEMMKDIISVATEKSFFGRMAKKVPMGTQLKQIPVFQTKPTAYFVTGDSGLKQTTTVAWKNVTMTAEEIAVLVPIPINVINDLTISIWDKIKPEIEEAFAIALDGAAVFGVNKPASWPSALVTGAVSAGNTVTQGTGVDIAADTNNVIAALAADGFVPRGIGIREAQRWAFQGLRDTTNGFIFQPSNPGVQNTTYGSDAQRREDNLFGISTMAVLNGSFETYNTATANAASLIVVDWDQVIMGTRQDMTMDFSKDAVIQDANGDIQFNAFQQDGMVGRFVMRVGYAVPNPVTRLQATEGSRWPAAVLRDAA